MNALKRWSRGLHTRTLFRVKDNRTDLLHHRTGWEHYKRLLSTPPSKWHGLWEPSDLKLEPDIPEYPTLHVKMQSYDCAVLEKFSKTVHQAASGFLEVDNESWASPYKSTDVQTFYPRSTKVSEKFSLQKYDRTVMLSNLPTTKLPLLLDFLQTNIPQGVEIRLFEKDEEEDDFRYVPDHDIIELETEKAFIESGKLRKK